MQPSARVVLRVAVLTAGFVLAAGFARQYFRFSTGVEPDGSASTSLVFGIIGGLVLSSGLLLAPFASGRGIGFSILAGVALLPGTVLIALASLDAIQGSLPLITDVIYAFVAAMHVGAWWLLWTARRGTPGDLVAVAGKGNGVQ